MPRALSAEKVVKGTSAFGGRVGAAVAGGAVTIVDDPFLPGGCFGATFDAEGVPSVRKVLIENGVLRSYLHNSYSSRKMGIAAGGNAVRASYRDLPLPGSTNLYLVPGGRTEADLIAELGEGVYVQDIMGMHTADAISGDFSVGICGFNVRSGEIVNPICEATMSGNIVRLLQRVLETGNELVFIGRCGSPAVLVEALSISGT